MSRKRKFHVLNSPHSKGARDMKNIFQFNFCFCTRNSPSLFFQPWMRNFKGNENFCFLKQRKAHDYNALCWWWWWEETLLRTSICTFILFEWEMYLITHFCDKNFMEVFWRWMHNYIATFFCHVDMISINIFFIVIRYIKLCKRFYESWNYH